jgi:hypothetical protein
MALDRFLYLNGIDYNCDSFAVGAELCIRDPCKLHTVGIKVLPLWYLLNIPKDRNKGILQDNIRQVWFHSG